MTKILIAEDERDIRELVIFTLRYAGYEVYAAINGEEALEMVSNDPPDLILLDVRMPRVSGYEVLERIKENQELMHIPVAFLSAKGQEGEVKKGLELGAVEYIIKPFAPDYLTERVKTILAKHT